jgi:hypothetical protein
MKMCLRTGTKLSEETLIIKPVLSLGRFRTSQMFKGFKNSLIGKGNERDGKIPE